ncbi:MAG TPA: carboxypeptidase-like regulatory domain-containing protein [Planctomycetota bacterium]|nr:carboxypeptidase-like regulatory domain-containing protein [Planctomycetota bacterium]
MRRLLLPAALLLAVLGAAAVLWPSWTGRTRASPRAPPRADDPTRAGPAAGAATADATGGAGASGEEDSVSPRVRGVVTGPTGELWGARVVACRAGTGEVLAEAHTNPDGAYSVELEAGVAFDLAVDPLDLTGLLPWRREGVMLRPGEELAVDVALEAGVQVRGRLTDENGDPVPGIVLRAVPEDPSAPATVSPGSRAAALAKSNGEGRFLLRSLEPVRYVLDILDAGWMFPKPVSVAAGGPDLDLVVVPGLRVELVVRDIETGDPVPAFTVRATSGELVLEAAGRDGAFSTRIRWPGQLPPRERWAAARRVSVDVAAPGLEQLPSSTYGPDQVVWMCPVRERNTTIHVSFDGGDPYVGELLVTIKSKSSGAAGVVRFERDPKEGAFRGALPWGDWEVTITAAGVYGTEPYSGEARAGPGLDASLEVTLPGGGTIVFFPPPGAERAIAVLQGLSGKTSSGGQVIAFTRGSIERSFAVSREGARVGGIPPGTYQIGVRRMAGAAPGEFRATTWIREITIDAKSIEEITLPE